MSTSNKVAFLATLHCLAGCAVGEVLGMVISAALNWPPLPSILLAIILAFTFGYTFSAVPLIKAAFSFKHAFSLVLAADTVSIAVMEIVDNGFILAVPGAIHADLDTGLFWISLFLSLTLAFVAAFPVNKFLISKGMGHAVIHSYHKNHDDHSHKGH